MDSLSTYVLLVLKNEKTCDTRRYFLFDHLYPEICK